MLSLCPRETEHRLAPWTFIIYVGLAVSEFISAELKESAEFLVFAPSFFDISGEHSSEYGEDKSYCDEDISKAEYSRVYPE